MAIGPITSSPVVTAPAGVAAVGKPSGGGGFADKLLDAVEQARSLEHDAGDKAARFADGDQSVGIHEVVIAAEKANVGVRFAVTLKNKVLEAYRELMNTPV
jgi:flagellar hook-basal body complex protein FliE